MRGRGDPDRAVEGAGEVDGNLPGDLAQGGEAADLGELHGGEIARTQGDRLSGLLGAGEALVGGHPQTCPGSDPRKSLQPVDRFLGQLEPSLLHCQELQNRFFLRPGPVGVDPDPRLISERLPHRPHLPDVTRHTDLELEGLEALTRPALAPARPPPPALLRSGSRCSAPAPRSRRPAPSRPAPRPAWPAGRAVPSPRRSEREGRGRRERGTSGSQPRSSPATASRLSPPRSDSGTASPSPSMPSPSRTRSRTISRRSSLPRAVT